MGHFFDGQDRFGATVANSTVLVRRGMANLVGFKPAAAMGSACVRIQKEEDEANEASGVMGRWARG